MGDLLKKQKLLIINQRQFGYHITYLKYCEYLKTDFEITYLCWDYSISKISEENINVIYVSREGNTFIRNVRFIRMALKSMHVGNHNIVLLNYFVGCSILTMFNFKRINILLNIVTANVSPNFFKRNSYNLILRFECIFFRHKSIISGGLKQKLKLVNKIRVLPLGADPMYTKSECKHKISLLYIGILSDRKIEDTIEGVSLFLEEYKDFDLLYNIVGFGWSKAEQSLRNSISYYNLEQNIHLIGYIPHSALSDYFSFANIGVSYIPIKPYFEFQPATKTYEYLMAGIPVIATGTYENKKIVNEKNGVIIEDNPQSFANGLAILANRIEYYNENIIRDSVKQFNWKILVDDLKNYLLEII